MQRKEIGFCRACPQVLDLEYLSHIKSTFTGARPRASSPFLLHRRPKVAVWSAIQRERSSGTSWGAFFCAPAPRVLKEHAAIHQEARGFIEK